MEVQQTKTSWFFAGGTATLLLLIATTTTTLGQTDLSPLSDEFGSAASMSNWQRVHEVEGWNNDPMEVFDINATQPGRMVMMPYTVTWYEN